MDTYRLFINGSQVDGSDGRQVETIDPATESPWARVSAATAADAHRAVEAARQSFERGVWAGQSREERAEVLEAIAEAIFARQDELVEVEMRDNGSTLRKASTADIPATAQTFQHFAELLRSQSGEESFAEEVPVNSRNLVVEEPYGVVVGIVPWNFPLASASWKIAPAIAAGNSIVLKPSPVTPVSALVLAEICSQAGVPAGVVNVVTSPEDSLGEVLVTHPDVRKVSFTGSTKVGRRIMAMASETVKSLTLELGGKSANIILEDADLDCASQGALFGTFFHNGQVCTSGTRVLVPRHLYSDFLERMLVHARRIRVGIPDDPDSTMGPLVSAPHWKNVDGYVTVGRNEGALCVLGGGRPPGMDRGYYYLPTIFSGVHNEMRIAQEEIFGPVVGLIPYEGEEEAVKIANESAFGLAGAVWSKDEERALGLARRLRAGTVWINDYHLLSPRFPFGGYKQSGVGRELGRWGLSDYSQVKHIHIGEATGAEEKPYFGMLLGDEEGEP